MVIVVVDFQRVVRESAAAGTVRRQIDELRNAYQEEFATIEEELRAVEAELTEQRTALSDEEFLRRRRDFEQRVTEAQRQAQYRRAELDRALDEAMNAIQDALLEVIAEIAEARRANVVLNRSNVIMVDQQLDLTSQALADLDAQRRRRRSTTIRGRQGVLIRWPIPGSTIAQDRFPSPSWPRRGAPGWPRAATRGARCATWRRWNAPVRTM